MNLAHPQSSPSAPRRWRAVPSSGVATKLEVETSGGMDLRAQLWHDRVVGAHVVAIASPSRLIQPARQRLGFRSDGTAVKPADVSLACAVLRRGEEISASFPTEEAARAFLDALWVLG